MIGALSFFNLEFLAQVLISRSFPELRSFISHKNVSLRVFPGGAVRKTLNIQYGWHGFDPWWGI